jgi:PBSX family phage terminase large subunit
MFKVAQSKKKLHILAGLDLGTIEKNVINKDKGLLEIFGSSVEYNASGKGIHSLPHIIYNTPNGQKIIYVIGYDTKARWKKVLGGQYGCIMIDEFNISDMDFVQEIFMRCDYKICTMNPDDPNKLCYKQYVNKSRPIDKYKTDAPNELLNMLNEPPTNNWTWWYFTFDHNLSLTEEKKKNIIESVPVGTKIYKNKIQGLRGKATGLIFPNFDRNIHVKNKEWAKQFVHNPRDREQKEYFIQFTAGLDTSYSQQSPDTIAMTFGGITNKGKYILLDEKVYNNSTLNEPIAPSDTVTNFIDFLERNRKEWGFARNVFIDSADQATITEILKYKRTNGSVYSFNNAYKKIENVDRINLQLNWFAKKYFYVLDHCTNYIEELDLYSWLEDKDNTPEDAHDHVIQSCQYSWIPYKLKIGNMKEEKE